MECSPVTLGLYATRKPPTLTSYRNEVNGTLFSLLFEVAHAARLIADTRFERLLGGRLFRPRLRRVVTLTAAIVAGGTGAAYAASATVYITAIDANVKSCPPPVLFANAPYFW